MRLAACGTAALGYFKGCKDEYKSASLDDVLRLQEQLRESERKRKSHEAEIKAQAFEEAVRDPEIIERMAAFAHSQWSGWMKYLFSKCSERNGEVLIPEWAVKRWGRQADTPYEDLPAEEKASDRDEARGFLRALRAKARGESA